GAGFGGGGGHGSPTRSDARHLVARAPGFKAGREPGNVSALGPWPNGATIESLWQTIARSWRRVDPEAVRRGRARTGRNKKAAVVADGRLTRSTDATRCSKTDDAGVSPS